jgi:hypothetical protein
MFFNLFNLFNPKRQVVIEHNITSNIDGERFAPVVIDGSYWGADFDTFNGDTLIHDDGEYGNIPVTFHQTFLETRLTDEQLLRKYKNQ